MGERAQLQRWLFLDPFPAEVHTSLHNLVKAAEEQKSLVCLDRAAGLPVPLLLFEAPMSSRDHLLW